MKSYLFAFALCLCLIFGVAVVSAQQATDEVLTPTQPEAVTPAESIDLVSKSIEAQSPEVQAIMASSSLSASEAVKLNREDSRNESILVELRRVSALLQKIEKNTR